MWRSKIQLPNAPIKVRIGGVVSVGAPAPATPATPAHASKAKTVGVPSSLVIEPPPLEPEPAPPEPVIQHDPQVVQLLEAVQRTVLELENRRRETLVELQQAVVELSVAIASQLTYRVIEAGEFDVEKMVQDAVSRLPASGHVALRLNPEDLELFHERLKAIPAETLDARSLQFKADPSVSRGGCLAELPEQGILSDIELLLGDLHTELMEGLSDAQVERRRSQGADRSLRRFPDRRETA